MSLSDWLSIQTAYNSEIFTPFSHLDLISFLKHNHKPISIAGSQYSSGGHTLVDHGVICSLKQLNRIYDFDIANKEYTVESGATWKQVIASLTPYGLVPSEMQSYNSFSVGGSISVNAHGRMSGRVSDSIVWLDVITVNGNIIRCSSTENKELFKSVVGGYGLVAIIWRSRLKAQINKMILCRVYPSEGKLYEEIKYFRDVDKVLYNCEIANTGQSNHIVWTETSFSDPNPLLLREDSSVGRILTRLGENVMCLVKPIHDWYQFYRPYQINGTQQLLSYEMGYGATDLIPLTPMRTFQSLLQEYFIPPKHLITFLDQLHIFVKIYRVNVLNESIRIVESDGPVCYLDWAPQDRIAVVLYINVFNFTEGEYLYREFTRKITQIALDLGGTWYLPYYSAFTNDQLKQGYPYLNSFLGTKKKYDPDSVLRSKFWEKLQ